MKKEQKNRIIQFVTIVVIMFIAGGFLHEQFVSDKIEISVWGIYTFFAISALLVYGAVEATLILVPSNTGYAFLMGLFIKMGAFLLIYSNFIMGDNPSSKETKLLMLIPFFAFLGIEALGVMKIMRKM